MRLTRKEIQAAVKDPEWQAFRRSLKGLSTSEKLAKLAQWQRRHSGSRKAKVQVQNYKNALKRGGLL